MRSIGLCALTGLAVWLSGCGSNLPKTVKITGRVTFDGQRPPGPGILYILPEESAPGFPSRPGSGDFGRDGVLKVTTFEPGDGLMPGKYVMYVECWEVEQSMGGPPAKSFVPEKYRSAEKSGLKLDVKPDVRTQEVNVDVLTK